MCIDAEQWKEIRRQFLEPFSAEQVEFLPRAASGGMALGLPYIDARDVQGRLDAVVGPQNWHFAFDVLSPDGKMVRGKLTVHGVTKEDAGEAAQEDEPLKSAVSDTLKRCAVMFGIGRYLYYLPRVWAPFDPQKRRFIEQPRLDPAAVTRAVRLASAGLVTGTGEKPAAPPIPTQATPKPAAPAPPAPPAAAPKAGTGVMGGTDPDHSRKAFFAQLREHFGEVNAELRHAISSVLLKSPVTSQEGWDSAAWANLTFHLKEHIGGCPLTTEGGGCPLHNRAVLALAEARAETAPEVPSSPPAPPAAEAPKPTAPANGKAASGALHCSGAECGRSMTTGQVVMSQRNFEGRILCPACQKATKQGAAA